MILFTPYRVSARPSFKKRHGPFTRFLWWLDSPSLTRSQVLLKCTIGGALGPVILYTLMLPAILSRHC
jgi:hypothetical protein